MKQYSVIALCMVLLMTGLSSCELVGDIFQAGFAVGIFVVVAIVGLIIWLVSRGRR